MSKEEAAIGCVLAIVFGCCAGLVFVNYYGAGNSGFEVEWWGDAGVGENFGSLLILPIAWSDPIDVVVSWEDYDDFELYQFDNDLEISPIAGEDSYLIYDLDEDEFVVFHAHGEGHFEVKEWM